MNVKHNSQWTFAFIATYIFYQISEKYIRKKIAWNEDNKLIFTDPCTPPIKEQQQQNTYWSNDFKFINTCK